LPGEVASATGGGVDWPSLAAAYVAGMRLKLASDAGVG
jgi:hypothetical protein